MSELTENAKSSLSRMQDFDVESLPREGELGTSLNFREVIPHAVKLIELYKRLSREAMDDIPDSFANQIKSQADADFNKLQEILQFDTTMVENPNAIRQQLIQQIESAYSPAFSTLHQFISYGSSVTIDVQRMENEARAMIQSVQDQTESITKELSDTRDRAQEILEDVRRVAAEQGVSQQAIHFKQESESHAEQSERWKKNTIILAWGLGIYAFLSLFSHKLPWIGPETTIQTIQFVASKILVFVVISYMLFLSARNFMSHKHNAIVNKHRQNALATFQALSRSSAFRKVKSFSTENLSNCPLFRSETRPWAMPSRVPASFWVSPLSLMIPKIFVAMPAFNDHSSGLS